MANIRTRLKTFRVAALGATAILIGSLATPPPAAAMRATCSTARAIAQSYIAAGNVAYGLGDYQTASYWYGRAQGVVEVAC